MITLSDTHIDIIGMAPLDERSAGCGDLNLTTHTTHKRWFRFGFLFVGNILSECEVLRCRDVHGFVEPYW